MNTYQTELYDNLMRLVDYSEAFFFNDVDLEGDGQNWYRFFNYRLASYTDFLQPSALECRCIMFEMKNPLDPEPTRLASLTPQKFFNLYENPYTMGLDLSTIKEIADKADGSLITTYLHKPWFDSIPALTLEVKTKGSLTSDQAINAKAYLSLNKNKAFKDELYRAESLDCTVIMEWCAPNNRIVLPYMEPHLKVLAVRNRKTGEYVGFNDIDAEHFPEILNRWVKIITVDDPEAYINSIDDMQGVEGVVFELESGQRVKKKCTWYLALHHTKDSINCPRRLYEAVLEEATDDMRSLFHDDPLAIKLIAEMEEFVEVRYNHLVDVVERFYERNKELERKDYAILGQKELEKSQFGLAMSKWLGKDFSYKEFMKKRWKSYGLKDEKVEVE
jgi:T4 RnlA family RNA ligase